jgi:hypothetical protein
MDFSVVVCNVAPKIRGAAILEALLANLHAERPLFARALPSLVMVENGSRTAFYPRAEPRRPAPVRGRSPSRKRGPVPSFAALSSGL